MKNKITLLAFSVIVFITVSHIACLNNVHHKQNINNKKKTMKTSGYRILYIGSSMNYTIFTNSEKTTYILKVEINSRPHIYKLQEPLIKKLKNGSSLIDEVHMIINDDSDLIRRGLISKSSLKTELFD